MDTYGANAFPSDAVAFPSDDDSSYTLLADKTGQKTGAYVEFMNYLAMSTCATAKIRWPRAQNLECPWNHFLQ